MALTAEQRATLLGAKVTAAASRLGIVPAAPAVTDVFPDGATWLATSGAEPRGVVLCDAATVRTLGPALVWAVRHDVARLDVVVDAHGGVLARCASYFDLDVVVWEQEPPAGLVEASPAAHHPVAPAPDGIETLVAVMRQAGVEVVVEHGIVRGEVLGLEVARIEFDDAGEPLLQVGVGRFDREASELVNVGRSRLDTLERAVGLVRANRRVGGSRTHPLHSMCSARWLRCVVIETPSIVGAERLAPVELPEPAPNLRQPWPAVALGVDASGEPLVVACVNASDLDAVPMAADARGLHAPSARLVLLCDRELPAPVRAVADRLLSPCDVTVAPAGWS